MTVGAGAVGAIRQVPRAGILGAARPLSMRARILLLLALVNVACAGAAGVVTVLNARAATQVEIDASLEIATRLVRETVIRLQRDIGRLNAPQDLQASLPAMRHVRLMVFDRNGRAVASREPGVARDDVSETPRWFEALIAPPPASVDVPVTIDGQQAAVVRIHGEASDEVAEVWDDLISLATLFVALSVAALAIFGVLLGRVLKPLADLADGMADLRLGRRHRPLSAPGSPELGAIVERFNALGQALSSERATNARMSWRMVSLQDDERRQIAQELHDELGPCLFGLRANVVSLEREVEGLPGGAGRAASDRLATVSELSERLAGLNRGLLRRLRPMALGAAPLAEVLSGLAADFSRQHPDIDFALRAEGLRDGYGEPVDLTVYRSAQEGITNAVRHARCASVRVDVSHRRAGIGPEALLVRVADDGAGLSAQAPRGFGLVGLGERLRALGGVFELRDTGAGAVLEIVLPLEPVIASTAIGPSMNGHQS